jgi:tetratricopeptide (TPR) repeat protein
MRDRLTTSLKVTAVLLGLGFVVLALYDRLIASPAPGDLAYLAGNRLFEDGHYERAAGSYREALAADPSHRHALLGLAQSLHKAGRHEDALQAYGRALEQAPEVGAGYANRGILLDTMGRHDEALADYERALELDATLADGPGWLTRFLRNQAEAPPTIADRARYLRAELAKPEGERVLRVPEQDARQRPYKQ